MSINSISPIDGRYKKKTKILSEYFSEKALIKYRIFVEVYYLLQLSKEKKVGIRELKKEEINYLHKLYELKDEDAQIVKKIETIGYNDILATNHDVKAVEYYIKQKINDHSLKDITEIIHFALTSEDINNISYSLMIRDGFNNIIFPVLIELYEKLFNLSINNKDLSMLARTHGQPASPTTFGKEILVFVNRIKEEISLLYKINLLVKLNGATGNFNAHYVVFPDIDWQNFSEEFIKQLSNTEKKNKFNYCSDNPLKLKQNRITTQIEPHDSYSRIFDSIKRINTILIDFCQDIWRYISDGWIKQRVIKGEIGSSAMPHKVNPIDFENGEGNLGVANSLFTFLSSKLSVSRLQRDLSDSTVLRNIGVAFAHSLVAYQSIIKGLSKIEVDKNALLQSLNEYPEVISEAYQSLLRMAGVEKPYELLKEATRGKNVSVQDFYKIVEGLNLNNKIKNKLLSIKPENYIGLALKIVEDFDPKIY